MFFNVREASLTAIAIEFQSSTSSGLPASDQYFSADIINIILNDTPPENQFTADSDSGEEINARMSRHSTQVTQQTVTPLGLCQLPAQAVFSCTVAGLA